MSVHEHKLVEVKSGRVLTILPLSRRLQHQPVISVRLIPVLTFSRQAPIPTHLVAEESSGALLGQASLPGIKGKERVMDVNIIPIPSKAKPNRKAARRV